jgi:outer membrane protein assembly factor BamB
MKKTLFLLSCLIAVDGYPSENWPMFRGPNASGVSDTARPPLKFGPDENVSWKVEVPSSPSSPCIWGERLFLTTFADGKLETRCYSSNNGKLLWSRPVPTDKLEEFMPSEGSPASSTPATDGKRIVSYFGSCGLVCYALDGREIWRHPLPVVETDGGFGSGTSPLIAGNLVILNRDQARNSALLAVDLETGRKVWQTARPEARTSYGTPIVWANNGTPEVVMPGALLLKGYDLATGEERWSVSRVPHVGCTTPVLGDGLLFFGGWAPGKGDSPWPSWKDFAGKYDKNGDGNITPDELEPAMRAFHKAIDSDHDGRVTEKDFEWLNSYMAKGENVLVAVKPGGRGEITDSHAAWKANRGLPYVPSPLFYRGRVYLVKDGGMVSCFDAKSGTPYYTQERLDAVGNYYASPVAADGHIYVASLDGKVTVFKAGGERPEMLHQTEFHERIAATPALVGPRLYLRTQTKLYALGK